MTCGSGGRTRTKLSSGMSRILVASVNMSSLVASSVMKATCISGDLSVVGCYAAICNTDEICNNRREM